MKRKIGTRMKIYDNVRNKRTQKEYFLISKDEGLFGITRSVGRSVRAVIYYLIKQSERGTTRR